MSTTSLVVNGIYELTHEHDGRAVVRVLGSDDVFARVEMVDPLDSTFQLKAGDKFKVVRARCAFKLIQ